MKTSFRKAELTVVISTVLVWTLIINVFFMMFDLNMQALLYGMSFFVPVGFLVWALVKKDYVLSGIFGFWSAFYIITMVDVGNDWFLAAMKLLPILASIVLVGLTFLRWANKKEEEAKIKTEIKAEEAKEMQAAQKILDDMPIDEIIKIVKRLIKDNKVLKILTIICCGLLFILIGITVFVFSQTPIL